MSIRIKYNPDAQEGVFDDYLSVEYMGETYILEGWAGSRKADGLLIPKIVYKFIKFDEETEESKVRPVNNKRLIRKILLEEKIEEDNYERSELLGGL